MRKHPILSILIIVILLTACGPVIASQPTADITANSESLTPATKTLTTEPTDTPAPTNTTQPSATLTQTMTMPATPNSATETFTVTPDLATPGPTPTLFTGVFAPGVRVEQGIFRIENLTDEKQLIVTMNGRTTHGNPKQPIFISYVVTKAINFKIPWGDYIYQIQIGDKRTITGKFIIRNLNKTTMKVYNTKVNVIGP